MILNILMFKNRKINAFTTPNFTDLEPEKAAKGLERSLIANADDVKLLKSYENLDLFFVGTFDDEIGVITPVRPEFLLSPAEIILQIRTEKVNAQLKVDEPKEAVKDEVSNN